MTQLDKYEVLSILGTDSRSTSYKTKNKETSEVFVWKAFTYNNVKEQKQLIQEIEKCMLKLEQPNSLYIYDYVLYEEKKVIYITCEFCINGNLANALQTCRQQHLYLDEEFLWRLLYQLAYILKQGGALEINLNDVFLDADFNIKLFRLRLREHDNFAFVVNELCKYGKLHYTSEFNELAKFISVSTGNSIDAILCHPKVLSKNCSKAAVITDIYVKNPAVDDPCVDGIDQVRLENLKNRELLLKNLEEKLKIKEHEVHKREKKVALQERIVRDKICKAELYLKRCRSSRSGKINLEDVDASSSFSANCSSTTVVIPTSKKLVVEDINKPPAFAKTTISERRVHFKGFKGHSPLKEITWNKQESTSSLRTTVSSKKALPFCGRTAQTLQVENNCRPISWTEETKQHAFDLLRIMKKEDLENLPDVKHTYL